MSIVSQKNCVHPVQRQVFTLDAPKREFSKRVSGRTFHNAVARRNFGVIITGWKTWGQEDIYPFMVGGVDATKTFGELP